MFDREITERRRYMYPPFFRLIEITLKHRDIARVESAAHALARECRRLFGSRAGDAAIPMIDRIRGDYLRSVTVKMEKGADLARAKAMLRRSLDDLSADELKGVRVVINADL